MRSATSATSPNPRQAHHHPSAVVGGKPALHPSPRRMPLHHRRPCGVTMHMPVGHKVQPTRRAHRLVHRQPLHRFTLCRGQPQPPVTPRQHRGRSQSDNKQSLAAKERHGLDLPASTSLTALARSRYPPDWGPAAWRVYRHNSSASSQQRQIKSGAYPPASSPPHP